MSSQDDLTMSVDWHREISHFGGNAVGSVMASDIGVNLYRGAKIYWHMGINA